MTPGGDPETNRFNPDGPMPSIAHAHERLAEWRTEWATAGFGFWAITVQGDPAVLGEVAGVAVALARKHLRGQPILIRARPANTAAQMVAHKVALERRPELDDASRYSSPIGSEWPDLDSISRIGAAARWCERGRDRAPAR